MAGLLFVEESEASHFLKKINARDRSGVRAKVQGPHAASPSANGGGRMRNSMGRHLAKGPSRSRPVSKAMISSPADFKHVGHVEWDADQGFKTENIDPSWKGLFDQLSQMGISNEDISANADFIKDFVSQNGTENQPSLQLPPTTTTAVPTSIFDDEEAETDVEPKTNRRSSKAPPPPPPGSPVAKASSQSNGRRNPPPPPPSRRSNIPRVVSDEDVEPPSPPASSSRLKIPQNSFAGIHQTSTLVGQSAPAPPRPAPRESVPSPSPSSSPAIPPKTPLEDSSTASRSRFAVPPPFSAAGTHAVPPPFAGVGSHAMSNAPSLPNRDTQPPPPPVPAREPISPVLPSRDSGIGISPRLPGRSVPATPPRASVSTFAPPPPPPPSGMRGPVPPPPMNGSPLPPPLPPTSSGPPPPPLPPPTSGPPTEIPPAEPARNSLMASIRDSKSKPLRKIETRDASAPAIPGADPVPLASTPQPSDGGGASLADSLAAALMQRNKKVALAATDDESEGGEDWDESEE